MQITKEQKAENFMKDWDSSVDTFIIYLHSHGSNRTEGRFLLEYASKLNFNLCLLDMRGSGDSKGDFSTLGVKEYRDVYSIVKLLQKNYRAKNIVLYGRSMGAASVMKFVAEYRNGRGNCQTRVCLEFTESSSIRLFGLSRSSSKTF